MIMSQEVWSRGAYISAPDLEQPGRARYAARAATTDASVVSRSPAIDAA
jgi:hypothetical protein